MVATPKQDNKPAFTQRLHLLSKPLKSFFHRISKSIMSSSTGVPEGLKTNHWTVSVWVKDFAAESKVLGEYMLKMLQLWKGDGGVQHELIVASFRREESHVFVAVERGCLQLPTPETPTPHRNRFLSRNSSSTLSIPLSVGVSEAASVASGSEGQSSTSVPRTANAVDTIWVNSKVTTPEEMVRYVSNTRSRKTEYICAGQVPSIASDPAPPTLINFVDAAASCSSTEPRYTVAHTNCYWFVRAILFVLGTKFPHLPLYKGNGKEGQFSLVSGLFEVELGEVTEEQKICLLNVYECSVSCVDFLGSHFWLIICWGP